MTTMTTKVVPLSFVPKFWKQGWDGAWRMSSLACAWPVSASGLPTEEMSRIVAEGGTCLVIDPKADTASRDGEVNMAECDAKHHMRFIGSAWPKGNEKPHAPSPVEVARSGAMPLSYLDDFGPESSFRSEIDTFKAERDATKHRPA